MKKVSLFLSMVAFVSLVATSPVSAQKAAPKKAATAQPAQPAAKKACCADPKAANCTMGKDGKACPEMAKKAAPAPKAK